MALHKLQLLRAEGGLAAPDYECYYIAAQLQWVAKWVTNSQSEENKYMEQAVSGKRLLMEVLHPWGGRENGLRFLEGALYCWK